jgi:IS30 family transposase
VRTYKRRSTYRLVRREQAARMRAGGMSLRQIARVLGVHHDTVWRDLRLWDEETASVTRLSDRPVGKAAPRGHESDTRSDSATITPIRRNA